MQQIISNDIEKVADQILGYLSKNSTKKDSLIGICDWWLFQERINYTVEIVAAAIQLLLSEKLIVEKDIMGTGKIYQINKTKRNEINRIVEIPVETLTEMLN